MIGETRQRCGIMHRRDREAGAGDLFWIFFFLSALQPVVQGKMMEEAQTRVLRRLEQQRGSRVIALIHRQETMSFLGFPLVRYLDIEDSEEILRAIHLTPPEMPIDLVVHTPGGLVLAAAQVARALRAHPGRVTIFVPHYAMSGGTLIALAADEIAMHPHAVLGPVDPQLGCFPAASIAAVIDRKPPSRIDDETISMADVAQKAIRQVQATVSELLQGTLPEDRVEQVAKTLATGTWTHDYPLTVSEARALGLPVTTAIPEEIYRLMSLYPQAGTRRPAVEYIPMPYHGWQPRPAPSRAVPRDAGQT
jgi:ClpP class serine protease